MNIRPLRDNIVVRLLDEPTPQGLIVQVELAQRPSATAEVEAVGPAVRDARVGQRVVVSRLQGTQVAGDPPRLVLRERAVLATLP